MRQAIRVLGWATNIFWITLLFFTVTTVYSAFQLGVGFGEPSMSSLDGTFVASLPLNITNRGFYDISDLNITTLVKDSEGASISNSSTFVQLIPRGSNASLRHNITVSLSQLTTENLSYLLFNDSNFNVDISLKLNYAKAVPFRISTNFTMPWGAPLSNLTLGNIAVTPYNTTHVMIVIPVSFENHSFFELNGTMRLEIVDNVDHIVGEGATSINSLPHSGYGDALEVLSTGNPANIREAHIYFETSVFSYGPVVILLV